MDASWETARPAAEEEHEAEHLTQEEEEEEDLELALANMTVEGNTTWHF